MTRALNLVALVALAYCAGIATAVLMHSPLFERQRETASESARLANNCVAAMHEHASVHGP